MEIGILYAASPGEEGKAIMKTLEVIGEAVRNITHSAKRSVDPKKSGNTATNGEKSRNSFIWATGWLRNWPEAGFKQPVQKEPVNSNRS